MPNIAAHIHITSRAAPYADDEVLFGSIAPDFAGMYRDYYAHDFRLKDDELRLAIKHGKDIHTKTDAEFDQLPDSCRLVGELARELRTEESLSRGAVKALSEVGTDILLDGEVIKNSETQELFKQIGKKVLAGSMRVRSDLASSPVEHMARDYFGRGVPPFRYQDPEFVATLMHRRLEKRGSDSLIFGSVYIDFVAAAFESQIARLKKITCSLLDQTVEKVAAGV